MRRWQPVAEMTGRSVGAAAGALKGLRAAGLLGAGGLLVPEAFWALAGELTRRSHSVGLASVPDADHVAGAHPSVAWALRGPHAAAAWGAPVVISRQTSVDLYVPHEAALRGAVQRYGAAPTGGGHAATVTPTPLVVTRTFPMGPRRDASGSPRQLGRQGSPAMPLAPWARGDAAARRDGGRRCH